MEDVVPYLEDLVLAQGLGHLLEPSNTDRISMWIYQSRLAIVQAFLASPGVSAPELH